MVIQEWSIFSSLCGKKVHMKVCRVRYGCCDTAVWIYKYKALWMAKKRIYWQFHSNFHLIKWQICQFTINFRKSHRQPQWTLKLVCEDHVLFVWVDLQVSVCGQQHPKCERKIRLVYPLFFLFFFFNLALYSNPQTKIERSWVWEIPTAPFRFIRTLFWRLKNKRPTWCHQLLCFISLLLCSTCFGH